MDDWDTAIAHARARLSDAPQDRDLLYSLAYALLQKEHYAEALPFCRKLAVTAPDWHEAHNLHASALEQLGHDREALDAYQAGLRCQSRDFNLNYNYGSLLVRLERHADALAPFRRAVEASPEDAEVHGDLGATLGTLGSWAEAELSHAQAERLDPGCARYPRNRGVALVELGRLNEAEATFRRALSLEPADPDLLKWLGDVLSRLERLEEALECLRQCVEEDPRDFEAHLLLARDYTAQGDARLAVRHYETAFAISDRARTYWPDVERTYEEARAAESTGDV